MTTTTTQITTASIHPQVIQLLALLNNADAVEVDSPLLQEWETDEPTGDPENQILNFTWVDDDGDKFSCTLTEAGVANGNWSGNSFVCDDDEGEQVKLTLYKLTPIAPSQA